MAHTPATPAIPGGVRGSQQRPPERSATGAPAPRYVLETVEARLSKQRQEGRQPPLRLNRQSGRARRGTQVTAAVQRLVEAGHAEMARWTDTMMLASAEDQIGIQGRRGQEHGRRPHGGHGG